MDAATLLARYDDQLRAEAEVADADEVTRLGPLWLASFPLRKRGFITYRSLAGVEDLDALIDAAVAHYAGDERIAEFEWKTRGHDDAPALLDRLAARGFDIDEAETVMAGDAAEVAGIASPLPDGYRVEVCDDEASIRAAEALAGSVFGDPPERSARRADELVARWRSAPDASQVWVAREPGGEVVCSGRVDFVAGTEFAGLWGGACAESHRGKGLYRAVTAARARAALAREKRYLQSDCTEFSRPILERAGLLAITTTTPATWHRI